MTTPIYFTHGEIIAESGDAKVYEFEGKYYLEIGPAHTLWAISDEITEYIDQIGKKAKGNCLEIGLGLGIASNYILSSPDVKFLTTIEINKDVIDVYKQLNDISDNHTIINQSGLDYLLGAEEIFDFIFLDFYDVIDEDTLDDIKVYVKLSKKILNNRGKIIGWFDIYTPDNLATEFFKLFKIN
jgi:hypothetical protein